MEGNQMKMRETLNDIIRIAKIALNVNSFENSNNSELWRIIYKCKSALSAPARNCDVGTPEEQTSRLRAICNKFKPGCIGCNYVTDLQKVNCWLAWAQMPYEAQEGGAE